MYQRQENPAAQAFYELDVPWMDPTPPRLAAVADRLAAIIGLPRQADEYPVELDSVRGAAAALVIVARENLQFELSVDNPDDGQLDRLIEQHIAPQTDGRFPREPLLCYALGAFWGEWLVRHRQACWSLFAPLRPMQSMADMMGSGLTLCSHPFSHVCKKIIDPEGDNLAYKAACIAGMKPYLPPYPLLAAMADTDEAARQVLPEPARRALDAEAKGERDIALPLYLGAAYEHPRNPVLLSRIVQLACQLQKFDTAIAIARRLVELVPDHPPSCHNLAVLLLREDGGLLEAHELLARAVDADPSYGRGRLTLARCLHQLGEADAARQHAQWVQTNDRSLSSQASELLETLDSYRWAIVTKQQASALNMLILP
jgi:tetratricopeptide (TPR) repeat protein